MTESFIVAATALAGVMIVFAPFTGAAGRIFMLGVAVCCILLHLFGRAVTAPERLRAAASEVTRAWWPLMLLSGFILGGSAYARLVDGIKETFLNFGIGMLFLPLVAVAVRASARPFALLKSMAVVYVITVLVMLSLLPLGRGPFHEEIFLSVPLGAYFLSARPLRAWQALLGMALLGACLLSVKNTTFLLVLVTLATCALTWTVRLTARPDRLRTITGLYFGVLALLCLAGALAFGWSMYRSELPTGSPEYRLEMYSIAWRRFLSSPVWGAGFTDNAVTYFELFRVATAVQNLPTHSDVLDMLAHGGLAAAVLWLATVWKLLTIGWDALRTVALGRRPRADAPCDATEMRRWRWLFVMSLVQFGAIVTYAFNPVLLRPMHGIWIWGGIGVMWALHRLLTDGERSAATPVGHVRRPAFA